MDVQIHVKMAAGVTREKVRAKYQDNPPFSDSESRSAVQCGLRVARFLKKDFSRLKKNNQRGSGPSQRAF